MKRRIASKAKKPLPLIETRLSRRRLIEFPEMKGRIVEKIEMFTMPENHTVTIMFQDKTMLTLALDPGFTLWPRLESVKTGDRQHCGGAVRTRGWLGFSRRWAKCMGPSARAARFTSE